MPSKKYEKIIAYTRVSTDQQAESGLGLSAQIDAIQKAVGTPTAVFTDEGISGSSANRPQLHAALNELTEGSALVVAKLDRLARCSMLHAWIEKEVLKRGAVIVSAAGEGTEDNSPTGTLLRSIVAAFSQYERAVIAGRIEAAFDQKRKQGKKCAHVPFGFEEVGEQLVPHPTEYEGLQMIFALREEGLSLRAIRDRLRAAEIRSKTGSLNWDPKSIQKILTSKTILHHMNQQKELKRAI